MAENSYNLFGFEIRRAKDKKKEMLPSIVPPVDEDGAGYVTATGAHYGTYVDIEGEKKIKDEAQLIRQYRAVAHHPEVDGAIEDITGEAISSGENEKNVTLVLDKVDGLSDSVKKQILDEFNNVYGMLNFKEMGHDMFKRWYIDGRMYHHLVVDEANPKQGIQEVRPIDASKIRKVPTAPTFALYSGTSNDTLTCDCAAKLYISSGKILDIEFNTDKESVTSP